MNVVKSTQSRLTITGLIAAMIISCKHELPPQPGVNNAGTLSQGSGGTNSGNGGNTGNGGTPCDPNTIYFEQDVLPIFISNCAKSGCHDAASHEERIILDSYSNVMATAGVEPNNLSAGHLYDVITENDPDDIMPPPPNAPLSAQQINIIAAWINQGAQNLTCTSVSCDSIVVSYNNDVAPIINNKCKGCHSGANPGGNIFLTGFLTVSTQAQNGYLMGAITHAAGYQPMPKNGTMLSSCETGIIRNWISEGAQNN